MGTMLDAEALIQDFKTGDSANFLAEVFWEELQFLLSKDLTDAVIVENHGMNSRIASRDILDVEVLHQPSKNFLKEFVVLHLSRNSIYHQLPEFLFHPLVISTPSMSNREIVQAIKENRKRERRNIDFLKFFDTTLFSEKVAIIKRNLSFLSDDKNSQNFLLMIRKILKFNRNISKQSLYWLFLKLCQAESTKENFEAIEDLLRRVVGVSTKIRLCSKEIDNLPFQRVGAARLGIDLGIDGTITSEIDDLKVTVLLDSPKNDYAALREVKTIIHSILAFFVYVGREIHIVFELKDNKKCILSVNHLGYDTYLT